MKLKNWLRCSPSAKEEQRVLEETKLRCEASGYKSISEWDNKIICLLLRRIYQLHTAMLDAGMEIPPEEVPGIYDKAVKLYGKKMRAKTMKENTK